jgi:hypothetical protein
MAASFDTPADEPLCDAQRNAQDREEHYEGQNTIQERKQEIFETLEREVE